MDKQTMVIHIMASYSMIKTNELQKNMEETEVQKSL